MKLHNTMSRTIEDFTPQGDTVSLYTCGLTVYSQPHIGNWVAYIYWDILVRTLMAHGYTVNRVQNITDVGHLTSDEDAGEDKMLAGALREGLSAWQVADKYIAIADDEAYNQLGLIRPQHMPRATDYIAKQIEFVQDLERKGYTYTIQDGVYFDTSKLDDYGKLARLDITGLQFGARVADTGKRNPTDFALWKFSPDAGEGTPKRDMEWESPFDPNGRMGFPGWHLECSVLAREFLGNTIDIHTGGIDHIPVHHTNEIAQSESLTGEAFAHTWVHANHIKVDGTKMSKSLGNIYTLSDITSHGISLDAFKLMILSKHYRTEGNFTWEILGAASNRLRHWQAVADMRWQLGDGGTDPDLLQAIGKVPDQLKAYLGDDLDTPATTTLIDQIFSSIESRQIGKDAFQPIADLLETIQSYLGISLLKDDIANEIRALIEQRAQARMSGNWQDSDTIRDTLLEQHHILIRDTPAGQIWERA